MLSLVVAAAVLAGVPPQEAPTLRARPAFELLPGGTGAGVSHVHTDLDRLFPAEMVGQWWALRGDGTTAGPLALSAVGSPTSQTDRVCPNGPDCAPVTSQRIDGTNSRFETASVAAPSGDFSCWAVFITDGSAATQRLVDRDPGSPRQTTLIVSPAGVPQFYVFKADASSTSVSGSTAAISPGVLTVLAATYDFVSDGASVMRLYRDGTEVASSSTAVGPVQAGSQAWRVGLRTGVNSEPFLGRLHGAGCTEKVLSPTTIAAMASAVLPQAQGSRGETLTTTRSTVRSCCNSAGCSMLPANRACVQGAAIDVSPQRTNLLQQSQAIDAAAWVKTRASVSANAALALDGTLTADKLVEDPTADSDRRMAQVVTLADSTTYTYSLYLKAAGRTWALPQLVNKAGAGCSVYVDLANGTLGNVSAAASGERIESVGDGWYRVSLNCPSSTGSATTSAQVWLAEGNGDVTYSGDGSSGVYIRDAQLETGSVATPYCPTTTSSAVCNGDGLTISRPAALDWSVAGCVAATVTADGTQSTGRVVGGNTSETPLFITGTTNIGCFRSGTPISTNLATSFVGRPVRLVSRWRGTECSVEAEAEGVSVTGTLPAAFTNPSAIYIGSQLGTLTFLNGTITDLVMSADPEACR